MREVVSKIKSIGTSLTTSKKQIIMVGVNEISRQLAERLIKTGQNILIIEDDQSLCKQIQEQVDVLAIKGKGTDIRVLKENKSKHNNFLIAIGNNDFENILTGIYAKQLGFEQVLVKITDDNNFDYELQNKNLGIDLVINPFDKILNSIRGVIKPGVELEIDDFLDKRVQISKINISHQNHFAYNSINKLNLPEESLIIAILRKGRVIIPKGEHKIYPGDTIFLLGARGIKTKLSNFVNSNSEDKLKIVMAGGGRLNYQLAQGFNKNYTTTIIEADRRRCEELADYLDNTLVLSGSGLDVELLKEEGVAKSDVFIAATADDEANLLMANLAKNLGVKNSIAIVRNISYTYLSNFIEIDHIISPVATLVDTILDYFYQGQVETNTIFEGQAKIFEIKIKKKRKEIAQLQLPADINIILIKRNKSIIIPNGNSRLLAGDKVVVLSLVAQGDIRRYFD